MSKIQCNGKTRLVILFLIISVSSFGQINFSNKVRLTQNWEFVKTDLGNIWEAVRPIAKPDNPEAYPIWEKIDLPHCFNAEDAVDPYLSYYQGPGWYRTFLEINNPYPEGRTILHFEGAGQKTDVYIFTEHIGQHIGGYDEWSIDITETIHKYSKSGDFNRFEGKIPLLIRCDNSRDTELIPSDLSDFNLYGGIYRYLNLVYEPAFSLSNLRVETDLNLKTREGIIKITPSFRNYSKIKEAKLSYRIFTPHGQLIDEGNMQVSDIYATNNIITLSISKPELWSPDLPNLYRCEISINSPSGEISYSDHFGFRHFEFKEKGPFFLNGKRLLLRGTHRHEDHAGVGAAMSEEQIIREMQMIKEMGVNFIRLGHYQQSRIVLEQCDKLGILVWEEIPWCRGGLGKESYQKQAKNMLTNMISQHYNHPSIILWGLGNENDWPNDFPEFDKQAIRIFMGELHNLSKSLDNKRLTCIRRCDFCKDIVDVYSPSIWAGWYRGIYTDYKKISYEEMQQVDHFLHVEWGGDSHAGRHAEIDYSKLIRKISDKDEVRNAVFEEIAQKAKNGDWSETYVCDLIDWHLKEQETMPWLTGTAYWPFKDFSTPIRIENPVPYVNQKGVVERDLTPKESYYLFQSYWTTEAMIHIYGHSCPVRWGKENEKKLIKVYSNCESVELLLNGKSLGSKKRNSQDFPAAGLHWEAIFKKGENTLLAVGKKGKEKISDEITLIYEARSFGNPAKINLSLIEDSEKQVWIEAELRDANGVLCLDSKDYFYFDSIGSGSLVSNQGTSSGSKKVQAKNGKAKIKLQKNESDNIVSVKTDTLETVFININVH